MGVRDIEASVRTYRDGCGLEVLGRGVTDFELKSGGPPPINSIRLGRRDIPDVASLRLVAGTGPAGRSPECTGGLGPVGTGFTTSDIFEVHQRLSHLGVRFLSSPLELSPEPAEASGPRRFEAFGQTSDGEFVVLVERRHSPTPYGTIDQATHVSEPLHTSHVVEDLETCRIFMEQVLDHRVLFAENCGGETFERLMALDPGASFRFQMLGHPDRETGRIIFIEMSDSQLPAASREALPQRGLIGLTYTVDDMDRGVATAVELGASVVESPTNATDHHLGPGRRAVVIPPFGIRLELFELNESR